MDTPGCGKHRGESVEEGALRHETGRQVRRRSTGIHAFMCVYTGIYACVCIVCVCVRVCTKTFDAYLQVYMPLCTHVFVHTRTYTHTIHTQAYMPVYTHVFAHTHTHTHTNTHTHTHTHTHTQFPPLPPSHTHPPHAHTLSIVCVSWKQ